MLFDERAVKQCAALAAIGLLGGRMEKTVAALSSKDLEEVLVYFDKDARIMLPLGFVVFEFDRVQHLLDPIASSGFLALKRDPAQIPACGHDKLHVHDYPVRTWLAITLVRYLCPACRATWRMLPLFVARMLWRSWPTVEGKMLGPAAPSAVTVPGGAGHVTQGQLRRSRTRSHRKWPSSWGTKEEWTDGRTRRRIAPKLSRLAPTPGEQAHICQGLVPGGDSHAVWVEFCVLRSRMALTRTLAYELATALGSCASDDSDAASDDSDATL